MRKSLLITLLVAIVLVGVPLGVSLLARSEPQTPVPVVSAMRHHYYLVGERQCERTLKKAEAQQGSGQLLGIRILIDTSKYPKEFREDVAAGCEAAPG